MALYPANTQLTTWLGTGAATTGVAAAGYYIPAANVAAYVGAGGSDTAVSNDIRDFLFSVLSKAYDTYSAVPAGDTLPSDISISRVLNTGTKTVSFAITIKDANIVNPYVSSFGTYS